MRKISWIASIVLIAVLLFFFVFPWAAGLWLQSRYSEIIKPFNQSPYMKAELIHFDRGWFHSQAQLRLSFDDDQSGTSYLIDQKIEHGPMMIVKSEDGSRNIILARAVVQSQNNDDNLSFNADTLWTMTNHLNTDLQLRHVRLGSARQQVELNRLMGHLYLTLRSGQFEAQFSLQEGALLGRNPEKIQSDLIDLVKIGSVNDLNIQLSNGERHFSAKKVSILPPLPDTDKTIDVDNWRMDLVRSQEKGRTHWQFNYQANQMSGGLMDANQLNIKLALRNMKTDLLENAASLFAQTSNFQRIQLYVLVSQLLENGMQVDIDAFNFITPEGPVMFQANLSSPEAIDHHMAQLQANAQAPHAWLQKELTAYYAYKKSENPKLKIEPAVMARKHMQDWLDHHFFTLKDDGQVVATLQYKEGQLSLNGEIIMAK